MTKRTTITQDSGLTVDVIRSIPRGLDLTDNAEIRVRRISANEWDCFVQDAACTFDNPADLLRWIDMVHNKPEFQIDTCQDDNPFRPALTYRQYMNSI